MKKTHFFIVFAVLLACFLWLNDNYRRNFDAVEERYAATEGYAVNLDSSLSPDRLARVLHDNNYVDNRADADFVADFLTEKLREGEVPEALLDLNKRVWQLPRERVQQSGTPTYQARLREAGVQAGWNEVVSSLYRSGTGDSVVDGGHGGDGVMNVEVYDPRPEAEVTYIDKLFKRTRIPSPGVWVRLNVHNLDEKGNPVTRTLAYACTDGRGIARFRGLSRDSSYSVLPVRQGYSYGASKGTYLGTLGQQMEEDKNGYSFLSAPQTLRLFSTEKLRSIREDGRVTVRTPDAFRHTVTGYMLAFSVAWLVLFAFGNCGGRRMDNGLAAMLMLITGLGMLLMFGINDPLTERLLGVETAKGAIGGVVVMTLLMAVDFKRLFCGGYCLRLPGGRSFSLPFDMPLAILTGLVRLPFIILDFIGLGRLWDWLHATWSRNTFYRRMTRALTATLGRILAVPGIGYMLAALLLTLLVDLVGESVGGMKVNLNLGFVKLQPSEITKFLLVIFMAVFWFEKGDAVIRYSQPAESDDLRLAGRNLRRKLYTMGGILLGLMLLIVMYLKLSDMGPALVVALTFIILYSLIKSRIMLDRDTDRVTGRQLFRSDISMLAVGIVSFVVFLYVGSLLKLTLMAAALWLFCWFLFGWFTSRQIHESPVMFNLIVFLFVCGTDVLTALGKGDIAQRLFERNQMCVNTWGTIGGQPGVNTQVAEGLWGLAGGGLTGQGLGNAQAHYIPAFHTDMILQSIGELLGLVGLAAVIIILSLVLRRSIIAGYHSGHPFLMYLCSGIAIVTGVQFFIISLGSLGVIPLTGVTVPFLSYGKVSLILNCLAFGIVLSVSARNARMKTKGTRPYNETLGVLSLLYTVLGVFVLATVASYQIEPMRSHTIIRPVYVYDNSGAAVIRYNPRIEYLTSRMKAGDIYDRNGVLLATSSPEKLGDNTFRRQLQKKKRYYPFGNHLYFMLGDAGSGLLFSSLEKSPYGYLAEGQHMSRLRGYDNRLLDDEGRPVTATLHSDKYRKHRFMPDGNYHVSQYQLRDYSVLLPFLKGGNQSRLLDKYNSGADTGVDSNLADGSNVKPNDIRLTLDAHLQTVLQQRIPSYVKEAGFNRANRRYERYSIVVMDALNGDLLASANYPLPDEARIIESGGDYNDNDRPADWTAFTERDLGLTFATNPGSTAKIMSALAGLIYMDSIGGRVEDYRYRIYRDERIHRSGRGQEPPADSHVATVDMQQAIVQSSNVYFINLVNKHGLYREMSEIYGWGGLRVDMWQPYTFRPVDGEIPQDYRDRILAAEPVATARYADYVQQRDQSGGVIKRMKGNDGRFTSDYWDWAWGEGTLDATPVAMARVAAAAATGYMPETRFLMDEEEVVRHPLVQSEHNLSKLREYMKLEARSLGDTNVGGKTGTPSRALRRLGNKVAGAENDGWYICFIDNASTPSTAGTKGKLAVAIRIERTITSGSAYAKDMMRHVVLPTLKDLHYLP